MFNNDTEYSKLDIKTKIVIAIICLYFLIRFLSFDNTILKNVDMQPFSEPIQKDVQNGIIINKKVKYGNIEYQQIANYKIYGRVYAIQSRPSKLPLAIVYPYDITICFGEFQHKEVFKSIRVMMSSTVSYYSYSGRAWTKHLSKYFKSPAELLHCYTNNHIVPANKNVNKGLKKLQKKDIVYIEGYLVKYKYSQNNGSIQEGVSSTARNDNENSYRGNNGSGSCEQIYVTRVVSRHGDFR